MVGVALGIRLKRLKNVFIKPKSLIVGLISQLVLLPAATFAIAVALRLPQSVALGLILVASCPGGNISNFMSSMTRGNIELSVSLTMFTTLGAAIFTPLNFSLWGNMFIRFAQKNYAELAPISINFWEMLQSVVIILVIPIIIGLVITRIWPKKAIKAAPVVRNISIFIFLGLVVVMIYNNLEFVVQVVKIIFLLVLLHNATAILIGYLFARVNKLPRKDRRTIAIETGIQNSGLALVLIFNPRLFDGLGGMAAIAAWWGIWHIISGLSMGFYWSKIKKY